MIHVTIQGQKDPEAAFQELLAKYRAGQSVAVHADECMFLRIRLAIAEQQIDAADVSVTADGVPWKINSEGDLSAPQSSVDAAFCKSIALIRKLRKVQGI